ncbi:TetR/AcrR family transcriptional regulator [Paenibacillus flagellatus]|uniref:TetR family transcriptional regulator n=1 Tax=Paenibacillus flagellatus TaxID=2211139 RepID=A0A2V5K1Y6_9BACL|nr:TetR family transcriptional regulator C-terminal domain-containing protein [Paenibacillus flagellatus]PYI52652.1 TetR family transcriptional regulator [Paenibacillus flagellatus]
MPKIVNHDHRKELIAEAAWRVIRREGLEAVSVRNVADEAGISLGSLRHYFETQSELLAFAMRLVSERVSRRIGKLPFSGDPRRDIGLVIAEILPLDEERRGEAEVWLAFAGKAIVDPTIRELSREVHGQLHAGFAKMLRVLVEQKIAREGLDAEYETKRLHALVDGLVVHHVTCPESVAADEMMRIVERHVDSLIAEPGASPGRS